MPGKELASPPGRGKPEKRRAVVVDCDHDSCALLLLALSQRGYAVTIAYDGREALGAAMRTPIQLAVLQRDGDGGRLAASFKSVSPSTLVAETVDQLAPEATPQTWRVLPRPLTYERLERLLDDAAAAEAALSAADGSSASPGASPNAAAAEPPLTAISSRPHEFS